MPLIDRVIELLTELDLYFWLPINADNEHVLVMAEAPHAYWICLIEALEGQRHLLVQVLLPVRVPDHR
jgi:hypothetical protein